LTHRCNIASARDAGAMRQGLRGCIFERGIAWVGCTTDIYEMDRLINAWNPGSSSICNDQEMIRDFRALADHFQIHYHTRRCRKSKGECNYGYPQPVNAQSRIQKVQYLFARSEADPNIVPHDLELLALL
jgi:hypothetical protein